MAAGYDGSIRIKALLNHSQFDRGIRSMGNAIQSLSGTLMKLAGAVGLAFGVAAIVNFGKESVQAASELSNAWMGLQSIVEGQGRSFGKAKTFVEDYVSDGLIPLTDAVTAYKNLAARGYNDEQIQNTMTALKDAAAFGRQSTYTLGQAVATAAEGLKNENSILVDNAGVTKNVAKMWDDYAKSIGTTANNLTQEQKIQAEVNGILEETRFQTGDAAKLVNTYSGQVAMLGYNFQQLKVQVGNAIIPIVQAVLPGINAIISALVKLAKVFAQVTSLLFGKAITGSGGQAKEQKAIASSGLAAADATDKLAGATSGAGKASKQAAKDMKGVLASFDELNILADKASGSVGGAAGGIGDVGGGEIELPTVEEGYLWEDAEISPKLLAEVEAFKDAIGRIWEVFKQSWEENGPTVIDSAKRALESLYELAKSIGSAFTEAWTGGAGLDFLNAIYEYLAVVLNIIADIADAWKTAFDNVGTEFFESILFYFTSMLELLSSIGTAFQEAWNNGTGVEICETILQILTNINNIYGTIFTKIQEAWEANRNGVAIWRAILDIIQTVLEFIERLTSSTLEWAQGLNFEPLVTAFRNLLEAINPLVEVITNGLAWAYENVLLPFGKWFLEELAPVGIEVVTSAIELLTSVLEALEPLATWLWETFLQPLAEWTGDLVIAALHGVSEALTSISDWISNNQTLFQAMVVTLGLFFAAWEGAKLMELFTGIAARVAQALSSLSGKIAAIISAISGISAAFLGIGSVIAGVVTAATSFFSMWNNGFSAAKEAVMLVGIALTAVGAVLLGVPATVAAIVAGIVAAVATAVILIKEHWEEIKEAAIHVWESSKEVWSAVGEWFSSNVIQPVSELFSNLGESISTTASNAWQMIQEIWSVFPGWFSENIIEPAKKIFTELWDAVQKKASDIWEATKNVWKEAGTWFQEHVTTPLGNAWEAVVGTIKNSVNSVIGKVEGMLNAVIRGINWLIDQLNRIKFDVPDWVPGIGGQSLGFNISHVSEVNLPRLANGAVIPPNQQFAAILGDQRSGKNLEAPASLIRQMVIEGIQASGSLNNGRNMTVIMEIDGREFGRASYKYGNAEKQRVGISMTEVRS